MDKHHTETFRRTLLALARRIDADLGGVKAEALRGVGGDAAGGISNAPLHLADLGTDIFEQEVSADLLQNQEEVMLAIQKALDRIDAGTYGICEMCRRPIPQGRLRALPYASRCVACTKRAEQEGEVGLTGQTDR
jgi:RNA polymerase-binding transcription factor DksA